MPRSLAIFRLDMPLACNSLTLLKTSNLWSILISTISWTFDNNRDLFPLSQPAFWPSDIFKSSLPLSLISFLIFGFTLLKYLSKASDRFINKWNRSATCSASGQTSLIAEEYELALSLVTIFTSGYFDSHFFSSLPSLEGKISIGLEVSISMRMVP